MGTTHEYRSQLSWTGSTAERSYDRTHRVVVPPAAGELRLSAGPEFGGSSELPNPEQLQVAAASSCQLLTFLAFAAGSHVEVLAYEDDADGLMPEDDEPMRITEITLRPRISVAPDTDVDRVRRLVERAHEHCFIANTVAARIAIEPVIERA